MRGSELGPVLLSFWISSYTWPAADTLNVILGGEPAALVDADIHEVHAHDDDMCIRSTEVTHLGVGLVGFAKVTDSMVVAA